MRTLNKMAKDTTPQIFTPLQAYAIQAHELFASFKEAGFTPDEAWSLLGHHLPDFELPVYMESMDLDELQMEMDEEDGDEEESTSKED
jgi:hypothetical protein